MSYGKRRSAVDKIIIIRVNKHSYRQHLFDFNVIVVRHDIGTYRVECVQQIAYANYDKYSTRYVSIYRLLERFEKNDFT